VCIEQKNAGGREAFLCKKYFELSYPKTQQHKECANKNLFEVLKLRRNSTRSALRVNLSQVQKLRRNSAFVHREVAERSRRLRNLSRFSELTKLRTDSTVVCRDPTRNAEVEKPLRFQS
jgi:hypothetical protein